MPGSRLEPGSKPAATAPEVRPLAALLSPPVHISEFGFGCMSHWAPISFLKRKEAMNTKPAGAHECQRAVSRSRAEALADQTCATTFAACCAQGGYPQLNFSSLQPCA